MKVAQPRKDEPIRLVTTSKGEPRYRVVLDAAPIGSTKRQQIRKTFHTLTEARSYVTEHKSDRRRGTLVVARRETFEHYAKGWLEARSRNVREVTARSYGVCVDRANAAFGSTLLAHVTRADVEALVSHLAETGHSKRTAEFELFVLRSIFEQALDDGVIVRNPARRVKPAGKAAVKRSALNAEQLGKIAKYLRDTNDPLLGCWLLTLSGLRRSEVLGLRWSDVDLSAGTVSIERGRVNVGHRQTVEGAPKTSRGRRTVYLTPEQVTALRTMRERQAAAHGFEQVRTGYLVVNDAGQPIHPDTWSRLWPKLCKAAGVPVVTLHAARHSSVTAMRNAGVPDHIVAAHHGHDESVMRGTYSHADEQGLTDAAIALQAAMTTASSAGAS